MAHLSFVDCTTYLDGYDFTGDTNEASLSFDTDELDATVFGSSGWRSRKGGLGNVEGQVAGFWQSATTDAVDPQAWSNFGTAGRVLTQAPTGDEAALAYIAEVSKARYEMFGEIGSLTPFALDFMGSGGHGAKRGLLTKAKGSVSATGATGTAIELPAVGASSYLYATFHVFSAGTTITAVVESDDSAAFSSATARITFGPITTAGGTWATRVAGAITDTHYRLRVTAITGTFSVACAVAVGS